MAIIADSWVLAIVTEPLAPITLPPAQDAIAESQWLQTALQAWLDQEFIPEAVNVDIAQRAAKVYERQRMEGETDVGCLLLAILLEMRGFDFSQSFFSEFAVANAVSELLFRHWGLP